MEFIDFLRQMDRMCERTDHCRNCPLKAFPCNDDIASTQSARQAKDATDLVVESDRQYAQLIRRLTPLECERLQGFPDGWTNIPGASDSARYRALGNSVPVPCVEFIMKSLQAVAAMEADVMQSQVQGAHHAEE